MTRNQYRRRWLVYHSRYEKRGIRIFRKALRKAAQNVPLNNIGKNSYQPLIMNNIGTAEIEAAYLEYYTTIGLIHGKRVGREINKQIKRFEVDFFDPEFRKLVRGWLLQNAGTRITTVRTGLIDDLIRFIALKIEEGKTMDEVAALVQKHILSRNFYRWQIERIVRTETTAAANYGAMRAGDVSGVLMVKEWVSSMDGRTRRLFKGDKYDHWVMDGVQVSKEDFFDVPNNEGGSDKVLFPGDPGTLGRKTDPANVINCRCTAGLIPKRDENGSLIFI